MNRNASYEGLKKGNGVNYGKKGKKGNIKASLAWVSGGKKNKEGWGGGDKSPTVDVRQWLLKWGKLSCRTG